MTFKVFNKGVIVCLIIYMMVGCRSRYRQGDPQPCEANQQMVDGVCQIAGTIESPPDTPSDPDPPADPTLTPDQTPEQSTPRSPGDGATPPQEVVDSDCKKPEPSMCPKPEPGTPPQQSQ